MFTNHSHCKDLARSRVLVVEKDTDTSSAIERCLSGEGYVVRVIAYGRDAVTVSEEWLPGLILLALSLPDTDGWYVCNQLRAKEHTEQIPIVFLTHESDPMVNYRRIELRPTDDYITKPLDIEELKLRSRKAIERSLNRK